MPACSRVSSGPGRDFSPRNPGSLRCLHDRGHHPVSWSPVVPAPAYWRLPVTRAFARRGRAVQRILDHHYRSTVLARRNPLVLHHEALDCVPAESVTLSMGENRHRGRASPGHAGTTCPSANRNPKAQPAFHKHLHNLVRNFSAARVPGTDGRRTEVRVRRPPHRGVSGPHSERANACVAGILPRVNPVLAIRPCFG